MFWHTQGEKERLRRIVREETRERKEGEDELLASQLIQLRKRKPLQL